MTTSPAPGRLLHGTPPRAMRPRGAPRPGEPSHRAATVAAAGVVALAALLRLVGVTRFPLEQDEIYTIYESRDLFRVALQPGIDARPLYFLLQHALLQLVPATPLALRITPLLFGVAGVWATWAIARRLLGPVAGVVAAAMVAISPWHLHASGMARYWTLLFLLSAAFGLYLALGYTGDRPADYRRALAALVLGTATHPTLLITAAGAALGASLVRADGRLGWRWPSRRAWTWLWGPFAAFLALGFTALRLAGREGAVRNWGGRGWGAGLRLIPAAVEWLTPALVTAAALGAVLLLLDARPVRRRWGAISIAGCLSAAGGLWALSAVTNVYADYAVSMLPLAFVSVGGLFQLAAERVLAGGRTLVAAGALVLAAAVLPGTASHLSDGTRFDYRPAFAVIAAQGPRLPVATWPLIVQRHYAPALDGRPLSADPARMDALLAGGDLWVIGSLRRHGLANDEGGRLAAWIAAHCERRGSYERPRWDYRMYRVELHRCHAPRPAAGPAPPLTALLPAPP